MNHFNPGAGNAQLETELESLPEEVATALVNWRTATLNREKIEALAYLRFKGEDKERSATEIRALVHADSDRYQAVLDELIAEGKYTKLYENLMSAKRLANLRTAF